MENSKNIDQQVFSSAQVITWSGFVVASLMSAVVYAFTNFETKENAKEFKNDIVQRLQRIETKLDHSMTRERE